MNGQNHFTFSMWLKTVSGAQYILSAANASNNNEFLFVLNNDANNRIYFLHKGGSQKEFSNYSASSWANSWIFLTFTNDATNTEGKLWVNGQLKDTVTISSNTLDVDNNGLWLGGDQDTVGGGWQSSQTYEGTIDEVRIYNRVLSSNEIVMLFN